MIFNAALLLFATLIWGYGCIATKMTFGHFDPYWSIALRFLVASSLSLPFFFYKKSFFRKSHILKESMISSFFLFGMLLFQALGLEITTIAKSGFITTLYSLFVPLIAVIFSKKKFNILFWFLLLLATLGMALMCNLELTDLNMGDFYTLICAFLAAFHILYIGKVAHKIESPIEFNLLQSLFVALLAVPLALIFKTRSDFSALGDIHSEALRGILFLAIISTMFSYTIQVIAQKKLSPHIVGIIFLMESPFAALFGYLILHENLSRMNIIGAFLIMISVAVVTLTQKQDDKLNTEFTHPALK